MWLARTDALCPSLPSVHSTCGRSRGLLMVRTPTSLHSTLSLPKHPSLFRNSLSSEFVQEVAGKGLALVYEAAAGKSKQDLVESLVEALSTGRRRKRASGGGGVDVYGGTHAGAALSEAGAGAYGEMCAVANDVGRPDLIYSFLSMASHHAAWTTRR